MDKAQGNKNQGKGDGKRPSFKPLDKNAPGRRKGDEESGRRETGRAGDRGTRRPGERESRRAGERETRRDGKGKSFDKKDFSKGKPYSGGKKGSKTAKSEPELVRLNKYIASAGICSRREADELIKAGLVSVNGKVVTEMGVKVGPGDDVRYNGERLKNEKKVYLVLNKPKDYVTTVDDPHATKTVMELIKGACPGACVSGWQARPGNHRCTAFYQRRRSNQETNSSQLQ